jgi:hypothetical protein
MIVYILFYLVLLLAVFTLRKLWLSQLLQKGYDNKASHAFVWKMVLRFILILTLLSLDAWFYREQTLSMAYIYLIAGVTVLIYVDTVRFWNRL